MRCLWRKFQAPVRNKGKKCCSGKCSHTLQSLTMGKSSPSERHGFARLGKVERLHNIWRGMKKRCSCPSVDMYHVYGGKGIKVCQEWANDYVKFRNWSIDNGYSENLSIDRKDCDKDYSPDNCKWSTMKEQARNRTTSHTVEFLGETKTLVEWSESYNIPYATLHARITRLGWSFEKSVTKPVLTKK